MGMSIEGVDPFYFLDLPFDRQLALLAYFIAKPKKGGKLPKSQQVAAKNAQIGEMKADLKKQGMSAEQIDHFIQDISW